MNHVDRTKNMFLDPQLSPSLLLDLSLAAYNLDLDDLRCATVLDTSKILDENADIDDEKNVLALLELTESDSLSMSPVPHNTVLGPVNRQPQSSLELLSQELCFNLGEVQAKHMAFSNDLLTTRDFFKHCRRLMDDFFESYHRVYLGTSYPENKIDTGLLHQTTPEPSFPAANTRARKAARETTNN